MSDFEILEGVVSRVVYANEDTGYYVFAMIIEDEDGERSEVVATSSFGVDVEEIIKLQGGFINHPNYGKQFKALTVEKMLPQTNQGMEQYLAAGNIKGIGSKKAKAIVEEFGLSTFDIFERDPLQLSKIKGITKERALTMGQEFKEKSAGRNTMMYLQSLGLSANQCEKIYKKYSFEAVDVIKNNPYTLIRDINGIGFKIADGIALKAGVAANASYRIYAGIGHILGEALSDGHVYLPKEELLKRACALLNVDNGEIVNQVMQMLLSGTIKMEKIEEQENIYLVAYYSAEVYCAKRLLELNQYVYEEDFDIEKKIASL
ncbi:MAG: helix-hairpin-helix domain-containing protein, partial [Defluviitaleaceae bacterium]|nr:helix-hairpin-helix domain-containing protein [Defluviitaleaceae bacterium]